MLIGHGSVPLAVVIGLKHLYLNTEQTLAFNLSILLNVAAIYRASGLVRWPTAAKRDYRSRGTASGQIAATQNIENLKKLLGGIPIPGTSYSMGVFALSGGGTGSTDLIKHAHASFGCCHAHQVRLCGELHDMKPGSGSLAVGLRAG